MGTTSNVKLFIDAPKEGAYECSVTAGTIIANSVTKSHAMRKYCVTNKIPFNRKGCVFTINKMYDNQLKDILNINK